MRFDLGGKLRDVLAVVLRNWYWQPIRYIVLEDHVCIIPIFVRSS